MYDMDNRYCNGWDEEEEWNDNWDDRIDSECCQGFVKEQFSIKATATSGDGTEVYRNSTNLTVTGTVILTNLGQRSIIFVVDSLQKIVPPNGMAALTATNIDHVTISTQQGTSRALLRFDIQVPSPAFECCV
ncbi:S-Ena type endospore appendage [Terrisporobacter sp.]|uniref:S-Ena type endospore appendage n=1 Tax=Terrisporobacter sp. TaxID=1965305 RepID=UPI0026259613|nr:S-Ena type endospore appendage [Terrisporobacter sp.]